MSLIVRGLSLRQPWADAVVYGGKRIENRVRWTGSNFRGQVLLHAAAGMTREEYAEAVSFMTGHGIKWHPNPKTMRRGGFLGVARVDGVVKTEADLAAYAANVPGGEAQRAWWMGGFALVLADVKPLPFLPWKGSLGFFRVDVEQATTSLSESDRATWAALVR